MKGKTRSIDRMRNKDWKVALCMILPFFLLFSVFVVIPLIANFAFSFTDYNLRKMSFIGLRNYKMLFKDKLFLLAFKNTLTYTFFNVLFTLVLSFFMALLLNHQSRIVRFARGAMYLPHITSMVAVSMIWLWMYNPTGGVFNQILVDLGLQPVNWLLDRKTAMPCIIFMSVWKGLGYNIVLFLAGLQGVPKALYEAADIDGASFWTKTFKITVPMVWPVLMFVLITNMISSFNVFESVNVMTNGGPMNATTTIVHQIYERSFSEYRVGYGAAMAIVLTIIVGIFTWLSFRVRQDQTN